MTIRRWNPTVIAAPIGKYSHVATDGAAFYISGQVGVNVDGELAGDTVETQTRQIFANFELLLADIGCSPNDLVKLLTFVVAPADMGGFAVARDETYNRWFRGGDWPAHSLAFVSALARPDLLVEIEGVAVREVSR